MAISKRLTYQPERMERLARKVFPALALQALKDAEAQRARMQRLREMGEMVRQAFQ